MASKKQPQPAQVQPQFPWYIPLIIVGAIFCVMFMICVLAIIVKIGDLPAQNDPNDMRTVYEMTDDEIAAAIEPKLSVLMNGQAYKYGVTQCHKICGKSFYTTDGCKNKIQTLLNNAISVVALERPINSITDKELDIIDQMTLNTFKELAQKYENGTDLERNVTQTMLCSDTDLWDWL